MSEVPLEARRRSLLQQCFLLVMLKRLCSKIRCQRMKDKYLFPVEVQTPGVRRGASPPPLYRGASLIRNRPPPRTTIGPYCAVLEGGCF